MDGEQARVPSLVPQRPEVEPVEVVLDLRRAYPYGVAGVVGERGADDLAEDVGGLLAVLIEDDAPEADAAQGVGIVRTEQANLRPVRVFDGQLRLVVLDAGNDARVGS